MKKIYIVTGANGFLGNNIIRKLEQDDNNEIRAFVLNGESIKSLEKLKCKIYYGDVTKKETLLPLFENIDDKEVFVIHCAAVVYIKTKYNPLVYNVNVNGTKNIVDKVLETKAKLIYISSVHAIPEKENNDLIEEITDFNPDEVHGLYAKTKAEAAKYVMNAVKNKNLNACIIHPSGIIGPYDYGNSHLTELVREVSNGKLFATVKGGYDFVDVRDVAAAIITASKKDNKGECYILSNKYITIKELSDLICDVQGIKKIKIVLPICLAKIIAPFFEAYYNLKKQTPLFTKYSLYTLSSNSNFSNKKAKEELGYKNRDIKDVYTTVQSVKNMNLIGTYDFFTSLVTQDISKNFPIFIPFDKLEGEITVEAKVRYSGRPAEAVISPMENGRVKVSFKEKQRAITKGQSVVFYQGNMVVGGGIIEGLI